MSEKVVTLGDEEFRVTIEQRGDHFRLAHDSHEDAIDLVAIREAEIEICIDGCRERIPFVRSGETIHFVFRGEPYTAVVSATSRRRRHRHGASSTSAPMPGLIQKIFVATGDVVKKGAPLLILEAMKMEHQISAPNDGVVVAIKCHVGELVQPGFELVTIEPSGGSE